jgi:hypothetical protein
MEAMSISATVRLGLESSVRVRVKVSTARRRLTRQLKVRVDAGLRPDVVSNG